MHARKHAGERPWKRMFLGFTVMRHGTRLDVLGPLAPPFCLSFGVRHRVVVCESHTAMTSWLTKTDDES